MQTCPPLPRIRLRLTWRQRRAFVLTVLGFQALVWADVLLNEGRFGGNCRTALVGVGLPGMAAATWWIGTSATRRGLVVHALPSDGDPVGRGAARSRSRSSSASTWWSCTTAQEPRGPPDELSAPTTGPMGRDEEFQDKVRVLRTFWAANRDRAAA